MTHTPAPEPGPDWPEAKRQWGLLWELHWKGLGLAYALLACRSLWAIIRSPHGVNSFARKRLFYAINWLLLGLGTSRSLYLWIDPYESGENIVRCPLWIVRPLFGIAFPCLMAAFCLVHIAFLEVAKIQCAFTKLKSIRFVVSIILIHFAVVIVSDTTVALEADRRELLIVCQSFFIVWGLLNSVCFLYSGSRVLRKVRKFRNKIGDKESAVKHTHKIRQSSNNRCVSAHQQNTPAHVNRSGTYEMQQLGFGNLLTVENGIQNGSKRLPKSASPRKESLLSTGRKRGIQKVAGITLVTSILSITCCALQIYSLFGVYSVYSKILSPKPWPWLAFQTSFRLVELSMTYTLSYCVFRSNFDVRKSISMWLGSLRGSRKRRAPRITIIQVKDEAHVSFERVLFERNRIQAK